MFFDKSMSVCACMLLLEESDSKVKAAKNFSVILLLLLSQWNRKNMNILILRVLRNFIKVHASVKAISKVA